jgi:hypothetical protein
MGDKPKSKPEGKGQLIDGKGVELPDGTGKLGNRGGLVRRPLDVGPPQPEHTAG